jgi:inner membrane protein
MKDSVERVTSSMRNSQTLRILSVGFLALLLQIPISMIDGLVRERQQRRDGAVAEVSSRWGNAQSLTGPALVVPYQHRWVEASGGNQVVRNETRHAIFLPERLAIKGTMKSEVRRRGIFSVPVYTLPLDIQGEFARPNFQELGVDPNAVDWSRAHLAMGISDARAIQRQTTLTWNGTRTDFLPGTRGFTDAGSGTRASGAMDMTANRVRSTASTGIHAPVAMDATTDRVRFAFPLALNGSLQVDAVPFGRTTELQLDGDYGHPSFQGNWLPAQRTVRDDGFSARWSVSFLGRSYPQSWTSEQDMEETIGGSRFGVQLVDPVDHYHMASRSVKYAGLFILLTFATLWLIEVLSGVRVHPIQYLLLGGALCLFYLLELSLSEHLGFPAAYALASLLVIAMVGAYSLAVLRRRVHALVVAAGVALLYAYLYLLLMNEDYALLIGSIGLFTILGAIMFVTRRVDWYAVGVRAPSEPSSVRE